MVLTIPEVFILGQWPLSYQVLEEYYNTDHKWHKQGATELLLLQKYLLINGEF